MSNESKRITLIFAIIVGAISGTIAGLIGDSFLNGLTSGAIAGGVTSLFFLNQPRSIEDPRIAVEAFSPAGLAGAVLASVITEAGWIGAFISSGIGGTLGLVLPALVITYLDKE